MNRSNIILECSGLSKQFGRQHALRSVSLLVETGACLAIFGRNGAGKTTLLKTVSSLIRSYTGGLSLFGQDLKKAGEETRKRIGFISHESFLYKDLTAVDNLLFYGKLYGIPALRERVTGIIERVGLEDKQNVVVRTLSRGMKQRLSLARAFLHEPELLLLDEPYTGLDERACEILDEVLAAFNRDGGTILLTTHNIERGIKHANKIVVLDRGSIALESGVSDIRLEDFRKKYRELLAH